MDVEMRALRIHEQASRRVIDKERNVESLFRNLFPLTIVSRFLQFPRRRAIVKARRSGNSRRNCMRSGGRAAHLDEAHRRAANFRKRGIQHQPLELKHAKSAMEKHNARYSTENQASGEPHINRGYRGEHSCAGRSHKQARASRTDTLSE